MATFTINAFKKANIQGAGSSTFQFARENGASANNSPGSISTAFRYLLSTARGNQHSIYRSYLLFKTGTITGTVPTGTSAVLNITGHNFNDGDFIVIKSTAFAGDGTANATTSDFFNSLDYSTAYSGQETTWNTGANTISLNSTALTDIYANNFFIVALVNYTHDYLNTASTSQVSINNGISFGSAITLVVTEGGGGPGNITSINTITKANVTSMNTIALANIDEINTIS